ncbi:MAG: hypothetical protein ACI9YL_000780 [Luteibaculaceae bacterium]|jgi:hypothetical protein
MKTFLHLILGLSLLTSCRMQDKVVIQTSNRSASAIPTMFIHENHGNSVVQIQNWALSGSDIVGVYESRNVDEVCSKYFIYKRRGGDQDEIHAFLKNGETVGENGVNSTNWNQVSKVLYFSPEVDYWFQKADLENIRNKPLYLHFQNGNTICQLENYFISGDSLSGKLTQVTNAFPDFVEANKTAIHVFAPKRALGFQELGKPTWSMGINEAEFMKMRVASYKKTMLTFATIGVLGVLIAIPVAASGGESSGSF